MKEIRRKILRTKRSLAALSLAAALPLWPAISGAVEAPVFQDAYVSNNGDAALNFGGNAALKVTKSGSAVQKSFIKFDLSTLPPLPVGASIDKVALRIFVGSGVTAGSFEVHRVTQSWTEGGVTNNTAPPIDSTILQTVTVSSINQNDYLIVNLP